MNNRSRLIINFNKKIIVNILFVFGVLIIILFLFLSSAVSFFIKALIFLFLSLLLLTFVYYFLEFVRSFRPIASMTSNGIWLRYFNFIPWNNIESIDLSFQGFIPKFSEKYLGEQDKVIKIKFKNISEIKNITFMGKISLFWPKIFKIQHVTLVPRIQDIVLDETFVDGCEVLKFANQYIKQSK